jgi:hypothetical protein
VPLAGRSRDDVRASLLLKWPLVVVAISALLNAPRAAIRSDIVLMTFFTAFKYRPIVLKGSEKAAFWPVLNSRKNLAQRPSSETNRAHLQQRRGADLHSRQNVNSGR